MLEFILEKYHQIYKRLYSKQYIAQSFLSKDCSKLAPELAHSSLVNVLKALTWFDYNTSRRSCL